MGLSRASLERRAAAALERGREGVVTTALGALWGQVAGRSSGPALTSRRALVAVTGATLGGSWKTPVSVALASALAARHLRVGLLGHGHRAGGRGRVIGVTDRSPVEQVGDEAWETARLVSPGVRVAIGPRAQALRWLEHASDVVVADGLRGASGERSAVVLAVDARAPWGSGRCPPAGDLRAPVERLLGRASQVVAVVDEADEGPVPGGWWRAEARLALPSGVVGERVAVVTSVARPERFVEALVRRGVRVTAQVALRDHGGAWAGGEAERALRGQRFDRVVCTGKCAAWLPGRLAGRPVASVGLSVTLPETLIDQVAALALSSGEANC